MAETLDYLGRPAPVSLAEKPALPVGTLPAPTAGPSAPSGGGVAPGGGAGVTPFLGDASTVVTTPTGAPGQPGDPQGRSALEIAEMGATNPSLAQLLLAAGSAGGKVFDALRRIGLVEGPSGSVLNAEDFSLGGEGGGEVLRPQDFSLTEDAPAEALDPASFSLGDATLDAKLPAELVKLALQMGDISIPEGLFDLSGADAGSALNPGDFSVGAEAPESVLSSSDFSLGADTTVAAPEVGGSIPWIGPALSVATALIPSLMNGGGNMGAAAVKAAIGAIQSMAMSTHPVMSLWNIPQIVSSISTMIEGGTEHDSGDALVRRARRGQDARALQSEILGPLSKAKTPEEFMAALSTDVGGSTVGDALASILNFNLNGTWFNDTSHGWLPDPLLRGLQSFLAQQGFRGTHVGDDGQIVFREPSRGDVGGVGEIVAGGNLSVPNQALDARREALSAQGMTSQQIENALYDEAVGKDLSGPMAWSAVLRQIAGVPEEAPSTFIPFGSTDPYIPASFASGSSGEAGPYTPPAVNEAHAAQKEAAPQLMAEYMSALEAIDPATAARVAATLEAQRLNELNQQWVLGGGGTG